MQEFNAAKSAVLKASPLASITMNRTDDYPVRVMVDFEGQRVWEARQQDLFSKYRDRRTKSIAQIEAAVLKKIATIENPAPPGSPAPDPDPAAAAAADDDGK